MMTAFAIVAHDAPGAEAIRTARLGDHLAHVEATLLDYHIAGPLRDATGATIGSLLIVKASDAAAARAMIERDPYFAAGVWSSIAVHAFTAAAGDWIGGKGW